MSFNFRLQETLANLRMQETLANSITKRLNANANINFERLSYIVERSEVGEDREKLLSIKIPEKPGSFLKLCRIFGKSQITEFNYRFSIGGKKANRMQIRRRRCEDFTFTFS